MSDVGQYMNKQLNSLINHKDTSGGKARLARLRHGAGRVPGEIPELWGEFLNGMPEKFISRNGEPSREEWAIYLSLTLFAIHQQGNTESVHCDDKKKTLGKAVAELIDPSEEESKERERILHRFGPVVTAKEMPELSHHLRCMIQLLSSKGKQLDYVQLAEDIYKFQFPESRKEVQLRWGQDFYYKKGEDEE